MAFEILTETTGRAKIDRDQTAEVRCPRRCAALIGVGRCIQEQKQFACSVGCAQGTAAREEIAARKADDVHWAAIRAELYRIHRREYEKTGRARNRRHRPPTGAKQGYPKGRPRADLWT